MVKPLISKKNKYWISKHRYYELKHFCMQYKEWKDELLYLDGLSSKGIVSIRQKSDIFDPVSSVVVKRELLNDKMRMLEECARKADPDLWNYILQVVTQDCSYEQLSARCTIPCSRGTFYDRYRKFFYILNIERG